MCYGTVDGLFPRLPRPSTSSLSRHAHVLLGLISGKCHRLWYGPGIWSQMDWAQILNLLCMSYGTSPAGKGSGNTHKENKCKAYSIE
jgi:hypothetical protein